MRAVVETTVWDMEYQPNHIYLLDSDRMLAYIPKGQSEPVYFKTPRRIDVKGRKFTDLKDNPFVVAANTALIEVIGSSGTKYFVDPEKRTCTCPAFKYGKGTCKHLSEIN
jgi:hypothetical protein